MSRRLTDLFSRMLVATSLAVASVAPASAAWPALDRLPPGTHVPVTDFPCLSSVSYSDQAVTPLFDDAGPVEIGPASVGRSAAKFGAMHCVSFAASDRARRSDSPSIKLGVLRGARFDGGYVGGGTHDSAPIPRPARAAADHIPAAKSPSAQSDLIGWTSSESPVQPDTRICRLPELSILVHPHLDAPINEPESDEFAAPAEVTPETVASKPSGINPIGSVQTGAVAALTSIRVHQLVQPFAAVGPSIQPTRDTLYAFLDWCNELAENQTPDTNPLTPRTTAVATVLSEKTHAEIPATEEPKESATPHSASAIAGSIASDDPSVVDAESVGIQISAVDPRVGGSAIITTLTPTPWIASTSIPPRQPLAIWSVLPWIDQPFCPGRHQQSYAFLGDADLATLDIAAEAATPDLGGQKTVSLKPNYQAQTSFPHEVGNVDAMLAGARADASRKQWNRWKASFSRLAVIADQGASWIQRQRVSQLQTFLAKLDSTTPDLCLRDDWMAKTMHTVGYQTFAWTSTGQTVATDALVGLLAEPKMAPVLKLAERPARGGGGRNQGEKTDQR